MYDQTSTRLGGDFFGSGNRRCEFECMQFDGCAWPTHLVTLFTSISFTFDLPTWSDFTFIVIVKVVVVVVVHQVVATG